MNDANDANDERVGEIEGGARGVDDDPLDRSEATRRRTVRLEEEAHGNDDDEDKNVVIISKVSRCTGRSEQREISLIRRG